MLKPFPVMPWPCFALGLGLAACNVADASDAMSSRACGLIVAEAVRQIPPVERIVEVEKIVYVTTPTVAVAETETASIAAVESL